MSREPFTPLGDRARWRIVYEIFQRGDVGDVITYETLGAALGVNPHTDRYIIYQSVHQAAAVLLTEDGMALKAQSRVGYKITKPEERPELTKKQNAKAGRALQRTSDLAVHVDLSGLNPEARQALATLGQMASAQLRINRVLAGRQTRLQKAQIALESEQRELWHGHHDLTHAQKRTAAEVQEIMERLRDLEETLKPKGA